MCGFVGVIRGSEEARVEREEILGMVRWIAHRGPSGEGAYCGPGVGLAACRLAVSGDERAAQPLRSADGRLVMAFNGEILGEGLVRLRRLIRAAGLEVPPVEAGDAPLLLQAIQALVAGYATLEGPHLQQLLEGSMGALVVIDLEARDTWLLRDRLGIKPLYVLRRGADLWFSSELKPLLARFDDLRRIEPGGMAELLHWQRPVRHLPFPQVESLGAGAAWCLRRPNRLTRWIGGEGTRRLAHPEDDEGGFPPQRLREAWAASARAAADVAGPVSLYLSGGLDSGAVALLAGRSDVLALTGRFAPTGGPLDESESAAAVADAAGLMHEIVDLRDAWLLEDLPAVQRALEVPMAGPGSLALWRMAARARRHGRVVLTGTGGDELLGGYARTALVLGRAGPWTEGYEELRARIDAAGTHLAMRQREVLDRSGDLRPLLDPSFLASLPAVPMPGEITGGGDDRRGALRQLVDEEIEGTLSMLLHVEDRIAMAHGLEGRPVPCLGDVPRVAAGLPEAWLVGPDGEGKRVLRAALAGLMPDAVRLDRRKRGFPTPFARAARGLGKAQALALIEDRRFRERGWWNVEACREAFREERPLHDRALFVLLSWETWARAFLDGDAFGPEQAA